MKAFNILGSVLLVLGLSLFVGCGGDSGSGGGASNPSGGTSTPTGGSANALTTENINDFARGISNKLGCEYTEGTSVNSNVSSVAPLPGGGGHILPAAMRNLISNVVDVDESLNQNVSSKLRLSRETETIVGDCGGKIVATTGKATGEATYVFKDYCNGKLTGERSVINGAIGLKTTQSDGLLVIKASTTQALNIVTTNPETDENVNVTIKLSDGVITVKGAISLDNLKALSIRLTAASGSITDNTTGLVYQGENLIATLNNGVTNFSATFTDPELGKVTLSGSASENQDDDVINIVGSGGSNAKFTTTAQEAVFAVTTNNKPVGTMDCSMVDTSFLKNL
jgi:hypothetical protein